MQPCLLAFCDKREASLGRAVLTAVARVGSKYTLFATCRHAISKMDGLFMVDELGTVRTEKWGLILPTEPDMDLSFVCVRRTVQPSQARINQAPIEKGAHITHARNKYGEVVGPPLTFHSSITKRSPFKAAAGLSPESGKLMYQFLEDDEAFREARREGRVTLYSVLEMESWPGVSGSGLWDEFGSVRGIVCGGDKEEDRLADGIPRLIYLPGNQLAKAVSLALKHEEVKKRMKE